LRDQALQQVPSSWKAGVSCSARGWFCQVTGHLGTCSREAFSLKSLAVCPRTEMGSFLGLNFKRYQNQHDQFKNMSRPTGLCACLSLTMCFQRILDKNQKESFENPLIQNNGI